MKPETVLSFVKDTQPMGGITFKDEFYNRKGDGYEACLHIYDFPNRFTEYWLNDITSSENTVVTVDTCTPKDIDFLEKISHSVEELGSRRKSANKVTEFDSHDMEFQVLRELALNLKAGEVIKLVHIRLFINAPTKSELKKRVFEVQKKLKGDGYMSAVFLDENKDEWQSLFLDIETQMKMPNGRPGNEIPAEVMGLGFAHDQTSLRDPSGFYFGYTRTKGTVYLDTFHTTLKRFSYSSMVVGDMNSGKSTTMKKLLKENGIRGNYIRGFDKSKEYYELTKYLGGKTINLDGTNGIINLMQVFPTVTVEGENDVTVDEAASFGQHVSKLNMCYRILNPQCTDAEHQQFDELVYDFYHDIGLWIPTENKKITSLPVEEYPILSDFYNYTIERYHNENDLHFKARIGDISKSIGNLVKQYSKLFDGHTTIPDLENEQIVFYDIGTLSNLKPEIFDIQIYNALTQIWGLMMKIGKREKEAYENHSKHWYDITRFLVAIDECHNIVNINKAFAADYIVTFQSEARKFFAGIILGTQRLERMFPKADNVSSEKMVLAANKLAEIFGLCQYKFIFRQDQTSMGLIQKLFGEQLTNNEYSLMPSLEKGDCILSISGDRNLVMHVEVTHEELEIFKGGA